MSKDHVQDSVREEFRKLSLDAKTAFLVEAIFSTAGSAINEIGSRLNDLVSLITDPFEGAREDSPSETKKAEPEEAQPTSSKAKSAKTDGAGSGGGKGQSSKK